MLVCGKLSIKNLMKVETIGECRLGYNLCKVWWELTGKGDTEGDIQS